MEYFYTPPHNILHNELVIEGEEFAHLTHVMRKKPGDALRVVNGTGMAYDAIIASVDRRTARCEITATHTRLNEPSVDVTLGVGILKNASKFDFVVEKVAELGVNTIVPLLTERTIPHHARVDRWQKLALAAMKQSGRCVLPVVKELQTLTAFMSAIPPVTGKFIPHEKAETSWEDTIRRETRASIAICIGPEGGFSDAEIESAIGSSFIPVSFGPRRLRTETAAVVAAGFVLSGR